MLIRKATHADASSLAAISIEVWINTYLRSGVSAFFADYVLAELTAAQFEKILSSPDESLWVSQNTEGIDGFIRVSTGASIESGGDAEITTLYVQPRHQAKKIGQRLLDTGLQYCAENARKKVVLTVNAQNKRAMNFYAKNGFLKIGETHFKIADQRYPNDILCLCMA